MSDINIYSLKKTSNPDIFRYVDLNGDWTHYFVKSKNLYVPAVNHIIKLGFPKGIAFHNYLLSVSKEEAKQILESAGEKGSRVHEVIKELIENHKIVYGTLYPNSLTGRPEVLNLEEWQALLAYKSFCDLYGPEVILYEAPVATDQFAGTVDFVGMITINDKKAGPKQVKVLLDWKTSGAIYDDYKLQTAAYWRALADKSIQYTGIVRLGTKHKNGFIDNAGFEIKLWDVEETIKHWKKFEAAFENSNLKDEEFVPDKTVMPSVISVTIPKHQSVNTPKPKKTKVKKTMVKKVKGENKDVA